MRKLGQDVSRHTWHQQWKRGLVFVFVGEIMPLCSRWDFAEGLIRVTSSKSIQAYFEFLSGFRCSKAAVDGPIIIRWFQDCNYRSLTLNLVHFCNWWNIRVLLSTSVLAIFCFGLCRVNVWMNLEIVTDVKIIILFNVSNIGLSFYCLKRYMMQLRFGVQENNWH